MGSGGEERTTFLVAMESQTVAQVLLSGKHHNYQQRGVNQKEPQNGK